MGLWGNIVGVGMILGTVVFFVVMWFDEGP
jgi:hypothetical protein